MTGLREYTCPVGETLIPGRAGQGNVLMDALGILESILAATPSHVRRHKEKGREPVVHFL